MNVMDPDLEEFALLVLLALVCYGTRRQNQDVARLWVHPMNQTRADTSVLRRFEQLKQFPDRFIGVYRMTPGTFEYLLELVRPRIQRQDSNMRKCIDPETRLCVTLHFLAGGINFRNLAFMYGLGRKTVSDLIYDCSQAIWDLLNPIYLKPPSSHNEWQQIADRYMSISMPKTI